MFKYLGGILKNDISSEFSFDFDSTERITLSDGRTEKELSTFDWTSSYINPKIYWESTDIKPFDEELIVVTVNDVEDEKKVYIIAGHYKAETNEFYYDLSVLGVSYISFDHISGWRRVIR